MYQFQQQTSIMSLIKLQLSLRIPWNKLNYIINQIFKKKKYLKQILNLVNLKQKLQLSTTCLGSCDSN